MGNSVIAGWHVTTAEDLVQIHLGHTAGRGARVVVMLGVDHHGIEHTLHLFFDLVEQRLQLAGFDEIGNIVVGVKALVRCLQPLANLDRDGGAFVGLLVFIHVGEFSEHAKNGTSESTSRSYKGFAIQV